jgi:hypothetical protein
MEGIAMPEYSPDNDPEDYEAPLSQTGGPNDDVQDPDVPTATFEEAAAMGENPEADDE